jgi:hypothetical protein
LGAYIYGIRYNPEPYIDVCEAAGVDYIEDVAQTYQGPKYWTGHPRARMTMFSYGLIKVQTTFNGAISVVRGDQDLFDKMKAIQNTYPMQTRKQFLEKSISKGLLGKFLFGSRLGVSSWYNYATRFTPNWEEATVALIRGFKPDEDFLGKFRI